MVQFPPFASGEVAVRDGSVAVRDGEVAVRGGEVALRGGVAPKVQTTSATNADNGVLWARWSTLWAKLSRTWCVVRTRTRYCVRSPAISHANPLLRVWAGLRTVTLAGPRACHRANVLGKRFRVSAPRFQATSTGIRLID